MQASLCIALILVTSTLATPAGKPRIIGGQDAGRHTHPWQASLQYNGQHICGASIISDRWLVTAAHCVDGMSRRRLTVKVAEHDLSLNDYVEVSHSLSVVIPHESYEQGVGTFPNDIALLKVSQAIRLDGEASTIALPTVNMDFYGNNNCKISGWGLVSGAGGLENTDVLQELDADIRSQRDCGRAWGTTSINSGHICVENGDTGACNGDSGGPLSCEVNGKMYLAGATSWGRNGCKTRGYPSVYSRVSYFREWIDENMMMN